MQNARDTTSGTFPMFVLAGISVVLMLTAALWQSFFGNSVISSSPPAPAVSAAPDTTLTDASGPAPEASSTLTLTPIGISVLSKLASAYTNLNTQNTYTSAAGDAAAKNIASTLRPDVTSHIYTMGELITTPDVSRARLIAYRSDLQNALKPLLLNTQYELSLYAHYVATQDPTDLAALQQAALNYHSAALSAAQVTVPVAAIAVHLNILNALERFASTLATQTASVSDPYASAALLSSYNTAESDVFLSFDALAKLFRDKIPS